MALYIISAVSFGSSGEVKSVKWAETDGATNKYIGDHQIVDVDRVVEALDRADKVALAFQTAQGTVSGGFVSRKILPGGIETIQEASPAEGRNLTDMPSF